MDADAQLLALLTAHNNGQPLSIVAAASSEPGVPVGASGASGAQPASSLAVANSVPALASADHIDVNGLKAEELEILLNSLGDGAASSGSQESEQPDDIIKALQSELAAAPVVAQSQAPPPPATLQTNNRPPGGFQPINGVNGPALSPHFGPASGPQFQPVPSGQFHPAPPSHPLSVPQRQPRPSPRPRQVSVNGSEEDEAKLQEKNRIREENRERKKRWRETNTDRNKDNDLRCRVVKRANRMFVDKPPELKQAWINQEFARRREKRIHKDRSRMEHHAANAAAYSTQAPGVMPPPYQHPVPNILVDYTPPQILLMFREALRSGNNPLMSSVLNYLASNTTCVNGLVSLGRDHGVDVLGRIHSIQQQQAALQQQMQQQQQQQQQQHAVPAQIHLPPQVTSNGLSMEDLPEGFNALIASLNETAPPPTSQHEQAQAESLIQHLEAALREMEPAQEKPVEQTPSPTDELLPEDAEDVDALLGLLTASEEPATSPEVNSSPLPTPPPTATTPEVEELKDNVLDGAAATVNITDEELAFLMMQGEGDDSPVNSDTAKAISDMDDLMALDLGDIEGAVAPSHTPVEGELRTVNAGTSDDPINLDTIDEILGELAAATEQVETAPPQPVTMETNQTRPNQPLNVPVYPQPPTPTAFTPDVIQSILSILTESMAHVDLHHLANASLEARKRSLAAANGGANSYMPPAKRARGPSPMQQTAVSQLDSILHTSLPQQLPRPPYMTPPPPRIENKEEMDRLANSLKPPPFRPVNKASPAPPTLGASVKPLDPPPAGQNGEAQKKVRAMGFPPMLSAIRKPLPPSPVASVPPPPNPSVVN
ncbi:hypothetical protein EX30DRAFT_93288 [Ascodesmis nigricans]|uniref:DUF3020 domain-containing protein n=1 Tax=Ascodesmis nigricans TaxID=341454 RepID=A0A4S2N420_9PEZI|nr:hypothetical protein EX30DRAFT_93288 [Ascodesmis nigricans]